MAAVIEYQLLQHDGNSCQHPTPSTQHDVLLSLLAGTLLHTLQRFCVAIAPPSGDCG